MEFKEEKLSYDDPSFKEVEAILENAQIITGELNSGYHPPHEVRELLSRLTGQVIDDSVQLLPPFHSDFGQNIRIGKNVFINMGCVFTDKGGIVLEDRVLIAPRVNLITVNHPLDPEIRRGIHTKPIHIKENAWIGAGATVLPGVTIGKNAVVAAGSVVTKDVPENTVVAGVPAKVVKSL